MYLIGQAFSPNPSCFFQCVLPLDRPIIGIGTPAKQKISLDDTRSKQRWQMLWVLLWGKIMKTTEILIHIDTKYNTYILNISWNREVYKVLKEAEFYAVDEGRRYLQQLFEKIGCDRCKINQKYKENKFVNQAIDIETFSDAVLTAVGNGGLL